MWLAAEARDFDEVVAAFDQQLSVASACSHQPDLYGHHFSRALFALATESLQDLIGQFKLPSDTCAGCLEAMSERYQLAPLELQVDGQHLILLDTIQRTHSDNGAGDGRLIWTAYVKLYNDIAGLHEALRQTVTEFEIEGGLEVQPMPSRWSNLRAIWYPTRAETTRLVNEAAARAKALCRADHRGHRQARSPLESFLAGMDERQLIADDAFKSVPRLLEGENRTALSAEGTRLMLALEIYERRHGAYPDSLDALVPGILPEMPVDPFVGGAFGYRLVDDDEHGRPYLLYSRGAGGIDNGGRMLPYLEEDPFDALTDPELGAEFDVVINLPWSE